eukprot:CAMPEP_0174262054 /NCGR_PEP_ID=MMETSP0439-20130205/12744_1 /TAXON_ID=0 /ORGANISM="Stereomyxa ramosa, Strain Chinc5" /LENGTH=162 /DNA_ID=CAMNT_0015346687 /DNA_START=349 /DNA_END=834 /DNA_ORIENTATION=+
MPKNRDFKKEPVPTPNQLKSQVLSLIDKEIDEYRETKAVKEFLAQTNYTLNVDKSEVTLSRTQDDKVIKVYFDSAEEEEEDEEEYDSDDQSYERHLEEEGRIDELEIPMEVEIISGKDQAKFMTIHCTAERGRLYVESINMSNDCDEREALDISTLSPELRW